MNDGFSGHQWWWLILLVRRLRSHTCTWRENSTAVSIGQMVVAICNIMISTAMIATFVTYTRSTGSCVAMEKSTSICFIVLTSEKSTGISSISVVIEKTISIRSLVCCSLLLITGFVRITVDGEESADVRCMVAIMVISLCQAFPWRYVC